MEGGFQPDLSVRIGPLELKAPVMPASGCFNAGREVAHAFDLGQMGAIINKTVMPGYRPGNPPQRILERASAMINSVGLPGKGPEDFLNNQLPFMRSVGTRVIVSIGGLSEADFAQLAALMDEQPGIDGLELDLSRPNHVEREPFALSAKLTAGVVRAVRRATRLPVIAKLAPNVSDIVSIAAAAMEAGADALCVANTYPAMGIDIEARRPILGMATGGLSGPAVKPMTLRLVWQIAGALDAPVIACGGVSTAEDALEYLLAGAKAVQVGTANFSNPWTIPQVIDGIREYLRRHDIARVESIIGAAQPFRTDGSGAPAQAGGTAWRA
ncbi:MAG: dihydroorotate dehydrogenase [Firmicutes bacterium]|nr:dihydroorotate dehydrogenase [Bacillota bacterium]